jgi:hypothetical protein
MTWGSPISPYVGARDAFAAKIYGPYEPILKHAVGDFDGDGMDEMALDFGAAGAWMWNEGVWSQISAGNPE